MKTGAMMKRADCIQALCRHRTDEIVVAVYGIAMDMFTNQPHPLNYYAVGAMGLASSHGLGLALARPDKRVLVLDGDGSLLMNLGSLVTCAEVAPPNFVHIVFENGTYEANGGHPIPGKDKADFTALARAAGYRKIHRYLQFDAFADGIGMLLKEEGPIFVSLIIEPQQVGYIDYLAMYHPDRRKAFSDTLRNEGHTGAQAKGTRE